MSQKIKQLIESLIPVISQTPYENFQMKAEKTLCSKELSLDESGFQSFVENLPVMFYAVDVKPPYAPFYLSPAFESLGYSLEEWQSNPKFWIQRIHSDDRERVLSETAAAIRKGEDLDYEYRIVSKDGTVRWFRDRGSLIRNENGKIICWQGIIIDVSAQKEIEQELKKREQLYRTITRNIPHTAVLLFDHDLCYTLAEGEQLERMGFSSKMLEGKTLFEVFPKKLADKWAKYYNCALAGGFLSIEFKLKGFVLHNYFLPLKNEKKEVYGAMSIWQDITERKNRDKKLQESEERYRELFEGASDLVYVHDLQGNYLSMNKATERVFGYTQEEILKLDMKKVIAPDQLALASQMMNEKLKKGAKQTVYELDCLTKNGRRVTLEINSSLIFKNDKPIAVQGIARDVTERKQMQEALIEREERLRNFFENANDLIYLLDLKGNVISANKSIKKLFGYSDEELKQMNFTQIVSPEYLEFAHQLMQEKLNGVSRTIYEIVCLTKTGRRVMLEVNSSPMYKNGEMVAIQGIARDITERKLSEAAISESEEKYRELFENANDLIYTIDVEGNFTSLNRAGEKISGYKRKEALTRKISDVIAPEYLEKAKKKIAAKLRGKKSTTYELEIIAKDGERVSLELSTRLIYKDGKPVEVQGIGRDITDRKKAEKALKMSESQYRLLSEGIMHQIWTAQPDGMLDYVNGRTLEYFGKKQEDLIKENWTDVVHPEDLSGCIEKWAHSLETGKLYEVEFRLKRHDGVYRWHKGVASAGRDGNGKIIKWFGTNTDIHDQKTAEEQLNHFAKHDALTSLPNRGKFMNHLKKVAKRVERVSNFCFAVLFLDLDRFKVINDSLGHLIGDKLLIAFAKRLENCIRPGDIVARLGGDEFTILLNNLNDSSDATRFANRLIQILSEPFKINDYEIFSSASIGIVISDEIERQPEDYLRDADTAMYRAKEFGKARYEVFNSQMHVRNMNLLRVENDLRHALERKEFRVFYQPIISLETGEICEFEALIRWQHPEHGLVQPLEFIEVAEETGLIIPIGEWILEESCRQTVEWQKQFPQSSPLLISVNLSSKQLMHPLLITQIREILERTKLDPRHLKLEVTESMVMENGEIALGVLNELKEIGVSLSTDDFGTGFSSLSYLHRFPFDSLKIDRSFIGEMDSNNKSAEIVRTIVMLAQNLNLETTAEGIETEEQLRQLQLLGCRFGQGYHFSKPLNAQDAEMLILEKMNGYRFTVPLGFQNVAEFIA